MKKLSAVVYWLLALFLAVGFLPAGVGKLAQPDAWIDRFVGWGLPAWLVFVVAVVEAVGGVLLLIPRVAPVGAAMVGTIMVGAIGTKVANGIAGNAVVDVVLLAASVGLISLWRRRRARAKDAGAVREPA